MHTLYTKTRMHMRTVWGSLGPGLTTGAADDDPAGITVYTQAGAGYGYTFAWFAFITLPFMAVVQEMCARIGVVTGKGLATHIREHYSRPMLCMVVALLFIANTLNIAADMAAIAEVVRLLAPALPYIPLVICVGAATAYAQVRVPYAQYASYLKYLTLSLFAYVLVALVSHVPWGEVGQHVLALQIPSTRDGLFILAALLGTTISPYLFFWQTAQEIEEAEAHETGAHRLQRRHVDDATISAMRLDVWVGMFFSNLITFFIIIAAAATLFAQGITQVDTVGDAMQALALFGPLAPLLFAVGVIGTGLLAIPVLAASSAYALAECFHWREGLNKTFTQARGFYLVICAGIAFGCVASLLQIDAVTMLLYSGFCNALLAPLVLYFVIRISSTHSIMRGYHNSPLASFAGWVICIAMAVVCGAVLVG